jgi:hypothetical protein
MSFRFPTCLLFVFASAMLHQLDAQDTTSSLVGSIEDNKYISPIKAFRVTIPVLAELGGSITDTENVVTFQDVFNTHQSIACFKMDATQRWEEETRGRKEYLIWFFSNFVQSDFQQRFPGARIESAHFLSTTLDGALLTFNLLPGGSMFAARVAISDGVEPPVAKRGNLLFVKNGYVFVLSIELAEKVVERSAYSKTVAEEDAQLRQSLLELLDKIAFATPPAAMPTAAETIPSPQKPSSGPVK